MFPENYKMSMIHYLLEILHQNGLSIELGIELPENNLGLNLKNPWKFKKLIHDRVVRNKMSMNQFKYRMRKIYLDDKESIAEGLVDGWFSHIGINSNEEIMYPYRNVFVKDMMSMVEVMIEAIMEPLFAEVESYSELSMRYFTSITMLKLMADASEKYLTLMDASKIPYEWKQLVQCLSSTILQRKSEMDAKK